MNRAEFWNLIDEARASVDGDTDALLEALGGHLDDLAPDALAAFDAHLHDLLRASYRNSLWGAAYLINGGCSDDGFHYFREWLIGQGRAVFEAALAEPDSLAEIVDPEQDAYELEGLATLALEAHRAQTGTDLPGRASEDPSGLGDLDIDFDDDEAMRRHYPRLFTMYCS